MSMRCVFVILRVCRETGVCMCVCVCERGVRRDCQGERIMG